MRPSSGMLIGALGLLVVCCTSAAAAERPVGRITKFGKNQAFIYHGVTVGEPSPQEPIDGNILVHHLDVLQTRKGEELRMNWLKPQDRIALGEPPVMSLTEGSLYLHEDKDARIAELSGGLVRVEGETEGYNVWTNLVVTNPFGTVFEVEARARESRVFVYDGMVSVSSRDPRFPDPVVVLAGQWVRAREGEGVSEPQTFILAGSGLDEELGSGGADCFDSDCTFVNKVPIPPPPVFTPDVKVPPPPNPPGRR